MVKKAFVTCVALTLGLTVSAQPPQDTPGPQHKNLQRFVGTWKMEGKMSPGPMGPGGPFTGTETCKMFEGAFHLTCDSSGSGAMGNMKGHMLLTWDRNAKAYRYFSVSNMADAEMATGTFNGNTWTFSSELVMDGKKLWSKFTIVETTPTVHSLKWDMSADGKQWMTVMEGKSTKQ